MDPFRSDMDETCLWRSYERMELQSKTFDLLVYLVKCAEALASKEGLLAAIWPETVVGESAMTMCVSG